MRTKLLLITISIMLMMSATACWNLEEQDGDTADDTVAEQTDEEGESTDAVSPEFDENGNPTGDYAKYLWEEEQREEAMDSIVREEQIQQDYEDDNSWLGYPY